jgi:NAD(P)-dependent dehydrogenase (short-subunit alcohol dehydrogenase family)
MDKRVVLITGCSSGIGLAVAQACRERDCVVVVSARRAQDVAQLRQPARIVRLGYNSFLAPFLRRGIPLAWLDDKLSRYFNLNQLSR